MDEISGIISDFRFDDSFVEKRISKRVSFKVVRGHSRSFEVKVPEKRSQRIDFDFYWEKFLNDNDKDDFESSFMIKFLDQLIVIILISMKVWSPAVIECWFFSIKNNNERYMNFLYTSFVCLGWKYNFRAANFGLGISCRATCWVTCGQTKRQFELIRPIFKQNIKF